MNQCYKLSRYISPIEMAAILNQGTAAIFYSTEIPLLSGVLWYFPICQQQRKSGAVNIMLQRLGLLKKEYLRMLRKVDE